MRYERPLSRCDGGRRRSGVSAWLFRPSASLRYSAIRFAFISLPVGSRGSCAQKSKRRGVLIEPSAARARLPAPQQAPARRCSRAPSGATASVRSPSSGSGSPITATSATARMRDQHILDLLRVDVHAARDDRETLAVGEEQIGVTRRRSRRRRRSPIRDRYRPARSSRVLVIFESGAIGEIHVPGLPGTKLAALVVDDLDHSQHCTGRPIPVFAAIPSPKAP